MDKLHERMADLANEAPTGGAPASGISVGTVTSHVCDALARLRDKQWHKERAGAGS